MTNMGDAIVLVLGAGATKACGGPLTAEILPQAFRERAHFDYPDALEELDRFLVERFRMNSDPAMRRDASYPPLPLLLSLLDTAIERKHALGPTWEADSLRRVRLAAEYAVFALIRHRLEIVNELHSALLMRIAEMMGSGSPVVVSLNYDILVDNALIEMSQKYCPDAGVSLPDYGCDVATPAYVDGPKWGKLLKLHGSMNWLYCPACHRLDVGISRRSRLMSVMARAVDLAPLDEAYDTKGRGYMCRDCNTRLRPVLITPTHMKDYRNPHIASVWYRAERALREATRAIFVGYSLPWDDVDVIYLLKRSLGHLEPQQITVVEHSDPPGLSLDEHDAGKRYMAIFGEKIVWRPVGLEAWLAGPLSGTS